MRKANRLDTSAFDKIQEARTVTPAEYLNRQRIQEPPKGWVTAEQIVQATGLAFATVSKHIIALRRLGKVKEQKFTIQAGKRVMPVNHYYLCPDAASVYFPNGLP